MPEKPAKSALILLSSEGTEEIEFVTIYDVLVRAGVKPTSLLITDPSSQTRAETATCSRRVRIVPDQILEPSPNDNNSNGQLDDKTVKSFVDQYDIIVLPGGAPGAARFANHAGVVQLVSAFASRPKDRWVAAICASTAAMVECLDAGRDKGLIHDLLPGAELVEVVGHPSVREKVVGRAGWAWIDDPTANVHVCGHYITSRGPATALLWSLAVVEALMGSKVRDEVAAPMIVP